MKNRFFYIALAHAARLTGKPGRMLQLVVQLMHRLHTMDRQNLTAGAIREQLGTLGRLAASYARGSYRAVPFKTLLTMLAAILYFLNPLDLVPDAILGVGFMDDLAVLAWVYRSARKEVDKFLAWEASINPGLETSASSV